MVRKYYLIIALSLLTFTVSVFSSSLTVFVHADSIESKSFVNEGTWGTSKWTFDSASGILTVSEGVVTESDSENTPWENSNFNKSDIKSIHFTGTVKLIGRMNYTFADLTDLTSINADMLDVSEATSISRMFEGDKSLTFIDVSKWNTTNITDMSYTFEGCESLTSIDVSKWDVSNVGFAISMFADCHSLQKLDVSKWNTQFFNLIDGMFQNTYSLKELDLSNWNINEYNLNVLNTSNIFASDKGFTSLETIKLGGNIFFPESDEQTLPPIKKTDVYTGRWIRVDPTNPSKVYENSSEFMKNYSSTYAGTYVWQKYTGSVIVKYKDQQGNKINDDLVLNGNVGDNYSTEQKNIDGYTFKEVQGNTIGTFTSDAKTVTYIYTKNPSVPDNSVTPASPEKPVIPDNGKTGSTTNNHKTVNNTTINSENHKQQKPAIQKLADNILPKTAAEKVGVSAVFAVIIAAITGGLIFKNRRNKQ